MEVQDGQPSVEDRMLAFVEQEGAGSVSEQADAEEQQEEELNSVEPDEGNEEQPEQQEDVRKLKLKYNGEDVEMEEPEVINLAQQGYDYTKKTQQLADERRAFEISLATLKSQEVAFQQQVQLQSAVMQDVSRLTAIDEQLGQYSQLDWNALSDSDPVQAQKLFFSFNQLQSQRQNLAQAVASKQADIRNSAQKHVQQQLAAGIEQLKNDIPDWGEAKIKEVRDNARHYGFTDVELAGVTDPRVVKALYDAAQWRKLQTSKPTVTKKVASATAPVKPGAKDANVASQSAFKQTRDALRKTGKSDYAAKLIERML